MSERCTTTRPNKRGEPVHCSRPAIEGRAVCTYCAEIDRKLAQFEKKWGEP